MKKKFFIVSDIHGEYGALRECLQRAGFDEQNESHILVSLGDEFDRGDESLSIYEYLKKLNEKDKAIIVKGNHNQMFIDYLDGTCLSPFNYYNNGLRDTFAEFMHETAPFETWAIFNHIDNPTYGDFAKWIEIARNQINKEYPELLAWLKSRPYYYETKNYIMTHGAIDTEVEDWRKPHCSHYNFQDWEALTWNDGSFFGKEIKNTDKTIVIGHFGTGELRKMYDLGNPNDFSILKRDDGKIIAIDSTTCISHKVNVLVIEDEVLE